MHGPDGTDYPNKIVYDEIVKPTRLVYTHGDDDGVESEPFQVTVTFTERGNKTELTMQMRFVSAAELERVKQYGAVEGAHSTLDRLEQKLAEMTTHTKGTSGTMQVHHDLETRELTITRAFDAPRELVWQTWTDCKHLQHWWGPKGWTVPVCELDLRPGGTWFYCMRGPDGEESWGKSTYQEILTPERLVYLDQFVDAQGNVLDGMPELQITTEFAALGNRTEVTSRTQFSTVEALQALLAMGVIEGITQTYDRLDEYLAHA